MFLTPIYLNYILSQKLKLLLKKEDHIYSSVSYFVIYIYLYEKWKKLCSQTKLF